MTIRLDTNRLIPGKIILGVPGLGILGSEIPSTGSAGPSVLYNDDLDPDKEYRAFWTTPISGGGGEFFAYEDGGFNFVGAEDGQYTGEYQHYEDGIAISTPQEVTVTIGGSAEATISITEPMPVFSVSATATTPEYSANIQITEPMPLFSATAEATLPVPVADVSIAEPVPIFSISATATISQPVANISVTEPIPVFSVSASVTQPHPVANISLAEAMPIFSISATVSGIEIVTAPDARLKLQPGSNRIKL